MSQADLLKLFLKVLSELGIRSMLVGSHASRYDGVPRSTHDVNLVIDLKVVMLSPEDSILSKLRWSRELGGSDQQEAES